MSDLITRFVKRALSEDIGRGDLFALCSSKNKKREAFVISKQEGVFAGKLYAKALCRYQNIQCEFLKDDGDIINLGDEILRIVGAENTLLQIERTLLNMLQHSSSIATKTNKFIKKAGSLKVLDTRKTRPHLREFEKYSVRCGGGYNHRKGLDDALMIKDTHLATIKNLKEFIINARAKIPWTTKIECECENFKTAKEAIEAKVDIIMCDNMAISDIKKIIQYKNEKSPHILVEASGNITLDTIEQYKNINLDAVSIGSIIHQAKWIDFSMKIFSKKQ
jgi:nicotinate-nucleotide pyrophosphorylase (carboxylating)